MGDAVREIWKDEFDAAEEKGRKEGRQEGRQEGIAEGRQEGREEGIFDIVTSMLKNNVTPDIIAEMCDLSLDKVRSIANAVT